MYNKFFDILLENIVDIEDTNGDKIPFNKENLEIRYEKRSNSSIISPGLYLNKNDIKPLNRQCKISFICRCGRISKILLRKVYYKEHLTCKHCIQDPKFPNRIIAYHGQDAKPLPPLKSSLYNFNNETNEYKQHYFIRHYTKEEFYYYLPYIAKINDILLTDEIRNKIKYFPYVNNPKNQARYTSKIQIDEKIETLKDVYLKCNRCGKIFKIHKDNIRNKNLNNILCKKCGFYNIKFPIIWKNKDLSYQSKHEKYFIDLCKQKNIKIINGPEISYELNNNIHMYFVDFFIPEYNYLIEIKGKNHYYYKDIKSGKFQAKCLAANNYANKHNMKFIVLYETNEMEEFIKKLINE